MGKIFLKLLNMSIQASILILIIVLMRFVLRKAPRWIHCILWSLVAIRLVCPFSVESVFSLAPNAEVISTDIKDNRVNIQSGIMLIDGMADAYMDVYDLKYSILPENEKIASGENDELNLGETTRYHSKEREKDNLMMGLSVLRIIPYAWLAGIIVFLAYAAVCYIRIWKRVKESIGIEDKVYLCDRIETPFILGIVNPRIYLPSIMNEEQKENVLAHERAHLKRGDHIWKPFGYLLLTVYWFNPFCWLAYILLCRDIELACDEKVIKNLSLEEKKTYSRVLLSFSESGRMISVCPLAFGEVGVKQRIKSVLKYKKPAFGMIAASAILSTVVIICFMTNPIKNEMDKEISEDIRIKEAKTKADEVINYKEDTQGEKSEPDRIPSDLKYEFDECTVEPRGYIFDGQTLYFEYDVVGDKSNVQNISVTTESKAYDTTYYVMNDHSEEITVMRAIIRYLNHDSSTDVIIGNNADLDSGSYVFHAEQNESNWKYSRDLIESQCPRVP